jgi:hypothetical protein
VLYAKSVQASRNAPNAETAQVPLKNILDDPALYRIDLEFAINGVIPKRRTSTKPVSLTRAALHPRLCPITEVCSFKFGDASERRNHKLAGWRRGIEGLCQTLKRNTTALQRLDGIEQIACASGQSINSEHQDGVKPSRLSVDEQTRPFRPGAHPDRAAHPIVAIALEYFYLLQPAVLTGVVNLRLNAASFPLHLRTNPTVQNGSHQFGNPS